MLTSPLNLSEPYDLADARAEIEALRELVAGLTTDDLLASIHARYTAADYLKHLADQQHA